MDISNLTSLPTDSLYKFMALSGTLIIIFAITAPLYLAKKLTFQLFDTRRASSILKAKRDFLQDEIDAMRSAQTRRDVALETVKRKVESHRISDEPELIRATHAEVKRLDEDSKSAEILVTNISDKVLEQTILKIELECDVKKLEFLSNQIKSVYWVQVFLLVAGIFLATAGFSRWYTKQQIFADKFAELQSEGRSESTASNVPVGAEKANEAPRVEPPQVQGTKTDISDEEPDPPGTSSISK
jgi:hypothetical protein